MTELQYIVEHWKELGWIDKKIFLIKYRFKHVGIERGRLVANILYFITVVTLLIVAVESM
jgi:hypothetical protein